MDKVVDMVSYTWYSIGSLALTTVGEARLAVTQKFAITHTRGIENASRKVTESNRTIT